MHIGFTGTETGMTKRQKEELTILLGRYAEHVDPGLAGLLKNAGTFHHGSCVGSDDQAGWIAHCMGFHVQLHPPTQDRKRAYSYFDKLMPEAPYMERNQAIVDVCDRMFGTPPGFNETLRGGTWATLRRAKRAGKPGTIILPNGALIAMEAFRPKYGS